MGGEGGLGNPNFCLSISFSWINLRLHTKNKLSKLPGSTLKVCVVVLGGWVVALEVN